MERDTAKQVVKLTEAIYYFLPIKVCFTRQGAYKGNGDLNHLDNLYQNFFCHFKSKCFFCGLTIRPIICFIWAVNISNIITIY